jgi:Peptidase_C39 like family
MTDTWSEADGWGDEAPGWSTRHAAPALAAYHAASAPASRQRLNTRALIRKASSPWWLARMILAVIAIVCSMGLSVAQAGEPSQRYETFQASMGSKPSLSVVDQVRPLTSLLRPDQYDSPAQFRLYSPAACSPTSLAEVLTAWSVPGATIGHMIDDLGSYLSPDAGLLDQQGFAVAAAKNHMRADISWHLTYNQILYLTNVLGIPVIVNFRRDYGYYHYFAGGHFLVVTGGDQQGVSIVDSSEYFIKYLPHDVFDGLWQWRGDGTAMTVVIVPEGYQYTLPAS